MNKLEQAARQALEALEALKHEGNLRCMDDLAALATLREALAEQPDTPNVDCACGDLYPADSFGAGFIAATGHCQNCDVAEQAEQEPVGMVIGGVFEPWNDDVLSGTWELYAAPVRTKDLTDEEIGKAIGTTMPILRELRDARAVIAADREKNRG